MHRVHAIVLLVLFTALVSKAFASPPDPPQPPYFLQTILGGGPGAFDPTHLLGSIRNGVLDDAPINMCQERYRNTTLDHFAWDDQGGTLTYRQRYFFCDEFWKTEKGGGRGPIFLYTGNEADVELYLNATGLMWESAPEFGALLLFVEHRYYGKSMPFGDDFEKHRKYLTTEQAIADYVEVVTEIKRMYGAEDSAVIAFGGSLGGMYAAWMRMKYPHVLDGALAASAPIWSFMGEDPPYVANSYARVETHDASVAAGSTAECEPNIRKIWPTIWRFSYTPEDRAKMAKAMGFCEDVVFDTPSSTWYAIFWFKTAVDYLSMGSYSFPSGYMVGGKGLLPAYPMRVLCSHLAEPLEGLELLKAASAGAGVYYNYTESKPCNDYRKAVNKDQELVLANWNYQYCTEIFGISATDGVTDMFWNSPWNPDGHIEWCWENLGVKPRPYWATQRWGGKKIQTASNIIFSNGEFDPCSAGGVLKNISESLVAVMIKEGGHHADLMFSHEGDSDSVKEARKLEKFFFRKWIAEKKAQNAKEAF
ncbi:hypothetical protein BSKO_05671 [Bryopsis sp. KO-2023]|nr:hypothetical protein BSKO_05671 [Bryopsis sp. KO-2023]